MGECSLRKPMEEECSKHCHGLFEEYERCGERIQSLDSLSLKKLQHKAVAHGLPIKTKDKKDIPKETLVASLQEIANCTPQYFEYLYCRDHCIAPKLFAKLK